MKSFLLSVALMALALPSAKAAIIGFDQFSLHDSDEGTPPVLVDSETIQFTTGPNQRRSLWFNARQDISQFTASFTYRANGTLPRNSQVEASKWLAWGSAPHL